MKLQAYPERLLGRTVVAFDRAVADTLDEARRVASRSSKTGRFERSLTSSAIEARGSAVSATIGSPLSSARVKERGGYIQAKRGPFLVIPHPDGSMRKVKAVRIPKRPVVTVAGPRFVDFMTGRLRELSR